MCEINSISIVIFVLIGFSSSSHLPPGLLELYNGYAPQVPYAVPAYPPYSAAPATTGLEPVPVFPHLVPVTEPYVPYLSPVVPLADAAFAPQLPFAPSNLSPFGYSAPLVPAIPLGPVLHEAPSVPAPLGPAVQEPFPAVPVGSLAGNAPQNIRVDSQVRAVTLQQQQQQNQQQQQQQLQQQQLQQRTQLQQVNRQIPTNNLIPSTPVRSPIALPFGKGLRITPESKSVLQLVETNEFGEPKQLRQATKRGAFQQIVPSSELKTVNFFRQGSATNSKPLQFIQENDDESSQSLNSLKSPFVSFGEIKSLRITRQPLTEEIKQIELFRDGGTFISANEDCRQYLH